MELEFYKYTREVKLEITALIVLKSVGKRVLGLAIAAEEMDLCGHMTALCSASDNNNPPLICTVITNVTDYTL